VQCPDISTDFTVTAPDLFWGDVKQRSALENVEPRRHSLNPFNNKKDVEVECHLSLSPICLYLVIKEGCKKASPLSLGSKVAQEESPVPAGTSF